MLKVLSIVTVIIVGMFVLGGCGSPAAKVVPSQAQSPAPSTAVVNTPAPAPATVSAPVIPPAPASAPAQTPTGGAALFTYSDLKITPNKVRPGGEVQVTATVRNVGGQAGTYAVVLDFKPDGDDACPVIAPMSKKVTLDAGAVENVIYDVTMATGIGGAYILVIDHLRGRLVVE